jgi:hypothetical protein
MKLIARTFAILAAALVAAGLTFAVAQSSYASRLFPARAGRGDFAAEGRFRGEGAPGAPIGDAATPGGRANGFGREAARGPSLASLGEVLKNLAIIGVIVALVVLTPRALHLRRNRSDKRPPKDKPGAIADM